MYWSESRRGGIGEALFGVVEGLTALDIVASKDAGEIGGHCLPCSCTLFSNDSISAEVVEVQPDVVLGCTGAGIST